jgi:hypothetical protein
VTATANGWRVIARDECTDVEIPGGEFPIHPEFAWLAQDCAILWHETVEPLQWPGCWGWAPVRPIRGAAADGPITNHASGSAWDLCAPRHPRGVPIAKTFTPAQLEQIARLEARYFGVLRWGGRWTGKDVDGMHWEGAPGVTVAAVRELTAALDGSAPPPAPIPPPTPPPAPTGWSGPDAHGNGIGFRASVGHNGPRIRALQEFLRTRYPLYAKHLVPDGFYGPQTAGVLAEFCRRSVIRSDGRDIGPQTARALYVAGFRA